MTSRKKICVYGVAAFTLLTGYQAFRVNADEPLASEELFLNFSFVNSRPEPKTATLGVHVTEANSALTSQLKLENGVGLLVEHVGKGSPAEKAGLQVNDVLHKLDDQLLINTAQLRTLVSIRKPKEELKLTLFRGGESVELKCVLAAYSMPPSAPEDFDAFLFFHGQAGNTKLQNCATCHQGHTDAKKHPKGEFDNFDLFHGKPGYRSYQNCSKCHKSSAALLKGKPVKDFTDYFSHQK